MAEVKISIKRKAVQYAAFWAFYHADKIHYVSKRTNPDHLNDRLNNYGPPPNIPVWTDCSGFARWCYLSAKVERDIGGWTGPQWKNGVALATSNVKQLPKGIQIGDLIFYGSPTTPGGAAHVVVYVGNGMVISHGSEEGPYHVEYNYRSDIAGYRTYNI